MTLFDSKPLEPSDMKLLCNACLRGEHENCDGWDCECDRCHPEEEETESVD
jgi:hypothetical protein